MSHQSSLSLSSHKPNVLSSTSPVDLSSPPPVPSKSKLRRSLVIPRSELKNHTGEIPEIPPRSRRQLGFQSFDTGRSNPSLQSDKDFKGFTTSEPFKKKSILDDKPTTDTIPSSDGLGLDNLDLPNEKINNQTDSSEAGLKDDASIDSTLSTDSTNNDETKKKHFVEDSHNSSFDIPRDDDSVRHDDKTINDFDSQSSLEDELKDVTLDQDLGNDSFTKTEELYSSHSSSQYEQAGLLADNNLSNPTTSLTTSETVDPKGPGFENSTPTRGADTFEDETEEASKPSLDTRSPPLSPSPLDKGSHLSEDEEDSLDLDLTESSSGFKIEENQSSESLEDSLNQASESEPKTTAEAILEDSAVTYPNFDKTGTNGEDHDDSFVGSSLQENRDESVGENSMESKGLKEVIRENESSFSEPEDNDLNQVESSALESHRHELSGSSKPFDLSTNNESDADHTLSERDTHDESIDNMKSFGVSSNDKDATVISKHVNKDEEADVSDNESFGSDQDLDLRDTNESFEADSNPQALNDSLKSSERDTNTGLQYDEDPTESVKNLDLDHANNSFESNESENLRETNLLSKPKENLTVKDSDHYSESDEDLDLRDTEEVLNLTTDYEDLPADHSLESGRNMNLPDIIKSAESIQDTDHSLASDIQHEELEGTTKPLTADIGEMTEDVAELPSAEVDEIDSEESRTPFVADTHEESKDSIKLSEKSDKEVPDGTENLSDADLHEQDSMNSKSALELAQDKEVIIENSHVVNTETPSEPDTQEVGLVSADHSFATDTKDEPSDTIKKSPELDSTSELGGIESALDLHEVPNSEEILDSLAITKDREVIDNVKSIESEATVDPSTDHETSYEVKQDSNMAEVEKPLERDMEDSNLESDVKLSKLDTAESDQEDLEKLSPSDSSDLKQANPEPLSGAGMGDLETTDNHEPSTPGLDDASHDPSQATIPDVRDEVALHSDKESDFHPTESPVAKPTDKDSSHEVGATEDNIPSEIQTDQILTQNAEIHEIRPDDIPSSHQEFNPSHDLTKPFDQSLVVTEPTHDATVFEDTDATKEKSDFGLASTEVEADAKDTPLPTETVNDVGSNDLKMTDDLDDMELNSEPPSPSLSNPDIPDTDAAALHSSPDSDLEEAEICTIEKAGTYEKRSADFRMNLPTVDSDLSKPTDLTASDREVPTLSDPAPGLAGTGTGLNAKLPGTLELLGSSSPREILELNSGDDNFTQSPQGIHRSSGNPPRHASDGGPIPPDSHHLTRSSTEFSNASQRGGLEGRHFGSSDSIDPSRNGMVTGSAPKSQSFFPLSLRRESSAEEPDSSRLGGHHDSKKSTSLNSVSSQDSQQSEGGILNKVRGFYDMFRAQSDSQSATPQAAEKNSVASFFQTRVRGLSETISQPTIRSQSIPNGSSNNFKLQEIPKNVRRMSLLDVAPPNDTRSASLFSVEEHNADDTDWEFWGQLVNNFKGMQKSQYSLLQKSIYRGIPVSMRGMVWQLLADIRGTNLVAVYSTLLTKTSPHEKSITQDLPRTFPNLPFFKSRDGTGQESLFNVLKCYSLYDPEVGYCQGLSFLAGPLLLNMPDEEAFCVLVHMMKDLRQHFTPAMEGLQVRTYQFEKLMEQKIPRVYQHLQEQGIQSTMYASQWFMTLFAYRSSMRLVFRIMDILLLEGSDILVKVALALLQDNVDTILALPFDELITYLMTGIFDQYEDRIDEIVALACEQSLSSRRMAKWAQEYMTELTRKAQEEAYEASLQGVNKQLAASNKGLLSQVETLNTQQRDLELQLDEARDRHTAQLEQNEILKRHLNEMEVMLHTERQKAEVALQDQMETLAQKNFSLVSKNADLEDALAQAENTIMQLKSKLISPP